MWQNPWVWAGLLMLILVIVRLVSGYDGLYGQDPYAYHNYTLAIQAHWRVGTDLGPFVWPRIYPLLGALWLWGDPGPWLQFLSMAGSALTLAMTIKLLQSALPNGRSLAALAFVFIGLAPFHMRYSLSILSDAPGMGLMTWALWEGVRYGSTAKRRHLLAAALLAGLSIWTRYPLALLLAIPCLVWVWNAWKNRDLLGIGLFLPVLLLAAIPHFWVLPHAPQEGVGHAFQNSNFVQWSPMNAFKRDFVQLDGAQHFSTPNILASFGIFWHPRFLGLGGLGLLAWLFRRRLGLPAMDVLALAPITLYGLFLAGIPFQNHRFLLPMLPFAALVLAPAWSQLAERVIVRRWVGMGAFFGILILQLSLSLYACRLVVATNRLERQIVADLQQVQPQGRRLYEFGFEAMLVARQVGFEKVNLWYPDIPPPSSRDLVLFNLSAFSKQFQDKWPMRNWHLITDGHVLDTVQRWDGGWRLYEIH